jgi:hypothetical protein
MSKFHAVLFILLASLTSLKLNAQRSTSDTAKPWVFWYWMQGGVSKQGITADLEAMKQVGISGAYLMSIKGPANPPVYEPAVVQLSPQWWEMVKFAMDEAKRLDLKLGMHVSDGFALAAGPWITPELSMQKVVSSRLMVKGGAKQIKLPKPPANENYYRDIAVYAFPSPIGTGISTKTIIPSVTTSTGADASGLVDPNNKKNFSSNDPLWIQYEFKTPFTCRSINIRTAGNNYQALRLGIEVSDDGKTFKQIEKLVPPRHGWQDTDEDFTNAIKPVTAKFFRFVYDKAGSEPGSEDLDAAKWKPALKILNIELSSESQIHQYQGKNGSIWRISKRTSSREITDLQCVPLNKITNLSGKLNNDGSLNWTAPKGNWTILRVGHTSNGHTNATAGGGLGLECDKFNPVAVKLQFDNWYGKALQLGGPEIAGKILNTFHVDSWECGSQNWSANFKSEFLKRRGYDLTPYLPIMTGLPVQSASVSENFLYDIRKTIAELVVDKFYQTLAGLTKEKGVIFTAESLAPTMQGDGLLHYKTVDQPMGEFWMNSPTHDKPNDMLDAISGAHIYRKNVIGAESFTTVRMDWNEHPGNMKTLLDRNFALGINKIVFHVFAHNPWMDRKPGMTLDGVGLYFQRDQTWWKQGKALVDYTERTSKLLQEGHPVVDIAVFTGEELPRRSVLPDRLVSILPGIFGNDVVEAEEKRLANLGEPMTTIPSGVSHSANMADPENWVNPLNGYAYDSFNPDVLLSATVKNKTVVFASGASYKLLIIPGKTALDPNYQYISYQSLKKLLELVKAGATIIVADKPLYQNGLHQESKDKFEQLINELWNGSFKELNFNKTEEAIAFSDQHMFMKNLGLGRIIKGPYYATDFKNIEIEPDLFVQELIGGHFQTGSAKKIGYAHRRSTDRDIYFVCNQENRERDLYLSFSVVDKIPIFYDAVTGQEFTPDNYFARKKSMSVPLVLAPNASIFIIFKDSAKTDRYTADEKVVKIVQDLSTDWNVQFNSAYGGPSTPVEFKTLTDWTKNQNDQIKYYSGTAIYSKTFNFNGHARAEIWLDLGKFSNIAEVKVNGIACGTLWTPPFKADISKAIRQGENKVEIEVTNTWANRLIGDHNLQEDKRLTKTTAPFRLDGKPLNEAGLLGPITLQIEVKQ